MVTGQTGSDKNCLEVTLKVIGQLKSDYEEGIAELEGYEKQIISASIEQAKVDSDLTKAS